MYVGVDSHKDSLAACVVDEAGRDVSIAEFPNTPAGHQRLVKWMTKNPGIVRTGIEGSAQYGWGLARALSAVGMDVREVPSHLTTRERRRVRRPGKSDTVDAIAIARIVLRERTLPPAIKSDVADELGVISDYRDELVAERTAVANRLHADLTIARPGYTAQCRSLTTAAKLDVAHRLLRGDRSARAETARRRISRLRVLDDDIRQLKTRLDAMVRATGTSLTGIPGVGPLVAARLLAEVGDIRRYPTNDNFASANGTAPIPASSGKTVRYRLNHGGNRRMNRALFTIALVQARSDPQGRAYLDRKRAAGKSRKEAIRCLKRQLSDVVYRTMKADIATESLVNAA